MENIKESKVGKWCVYELNNYPNLGKVLGENPELEIPDDGKSLVIEGLSFNANKRVLSGSIVTTFNSLEKAVWYYTSVMAKEAPEKCITYEETIKDIQDYYLNKK